MDVSLQKKRWRPEIAPPTEEILTEGQKQLKTLLDKQLQKDVTIQQWGFESWSKQYNI